MSFYLRKSSQEKEVLDDSWNMLKQKQGESLNDYWGRACAIWMKLRFYGDNRDECSMCKHIARGLLDEYTTVWRLILFHTSLTRVSMQETLRVAEQELRSGGSMDTEREEMRHALVAAGVGGGNAGGGGTQGAAALGGGGAIQQNEARFFYEEHGPNDSHDTVNCIWIRKQFALNYRQFMGPCARSNAQRSGHGFHPGAGGERGVFRAVKIRSSSSTMHKVGLAGAVAGRKRNRRRHVAKGTDLEGMEAETLGGGAMAAINLTPRMHVVGPEAEAAEAIFRHLICRRGSLPTVNGRLSRRTWRSATTAPQTGALFQTKIGGQHQGGGRRRGREASRTDTWRRAWTMAEVPTGLPGETFPPDQAAGMFLTVWDSCKAGK